MKLKKQVVTLMVLGMVFVSGCLPQQTIVPTKENLTLEPEEPPTEGTTVTKTGDLTIHGNVTPIDTSIIIRLTQKHKIVQTTHPDEDGVYRFTNLSQGKYGLSFVHASKVYIYDYSFHDEYFADEDGGTTNLTKIESVDPSEEVTYEMNLDKELPDFFAGGISFIVNSSVSEDKIIGLIDSCDCKILKKATFRQGDAMIYTITIPKGKTELEIIDFFSEN